MTTVEGREVHPQVRYRFGDCELDVGAYRFTRAGRVVHLTPKLFDLLRYLIERRGQAVTKNELLDTLWADAHVNEVSVPWAISHLRRALGQASKAKAPIATLYGRGYRFVAEVRVLQGDAAAAQEPPAGDAPDDAAPPPAWDEAPLIGRAATMDALSARLSSARAGRGGCCMLVGPPGIGKTRCLEELASRAQAQGFAAWWGRSPGHAVTPVLWAFVQVLRQLAVDRPALAERAQQLLSRLDEAQRAGAVANEADHGSDGEGASAPRSFWLLDGIDALLQQAASDGPLLLLFDDLHQADAASIESLRYLAPELARHRVLVVCTQHGAPGPRERQLRRLSRHVERSELSPLDVDDVGAYLAAFADDGAPPDPPLCRALHAATAGNPLFLQQTLRELLQRHGREGLATLDPAQVQPVKSAQEFLRSALDVLDDGTRRLLSLASVLGEDVELGLLQRLSQLDADALLSALDAADAHGFVVPDLPARFRFRHGLLCATVYEELPAGERARLHRRAAELLEARASGEQEHGEIARHYHSSLPLGDHARIVASCRTAARSALRAQAFADAATYLRWALQAEAEDPAAQPRVRAELLLQHAQLCGAAGRVAAAVRSIDELEPLARSHGHWDLLVRAARVLRPTHLLAGQGDARARAMLEDALAAAGQGDRRLRISALSQLAIVPPHAFDIARSKELSGQALSLARELDVDVGLFEALHARLYGLSGPDDVDALVASARELIERDRTPPTWFTMEALMALHGAHLLRGQLPQAEAALAAIGRNAREHNWQEAVWSHARLQAQRLLLTGEFAQAEAALQELGVRARRLGIGYGAGVIDLMRTVLLAKRDGAGAMASQFRATRSEIPLDGFVPGLRPTFASIALSCGQRDAALGVLQAMVGAGRAGAGAQAAIDVPRDVGYLNAAANLALLAIELGDGARVELLYDELLPYAQYNTPNCLMWYDGSVSHHLALLAVARGQHAAARAHFDDALAMNEAWGLRPRLAETLHAYARLQLEAARSPAARAKGQDLQARALGLAQELGMQWLTERVRALG